MSIENPPERSMPVTPLSSRKDKSEKKDKSGDSKKRKRDHGDDVKPKSKKHKKHKAAAKEAAEEHDSTHYSAEQSPFHTQTSSLYLPLAPISQRKPLEGMCAEHLSPLILNYYPPFSAIVLSYSNPRLSERPYGDDGDRILLQCIDEYAVSWAWVTAEFLLFKPERGGWLEGYINLQNEGHLGLVCWNLFNASIDRKRLPKDWNWIGLESNGNPKRKKRDDAQPDYMVGHWVDGQGNDIEGMIRFRVKDIETGYDKERGFLTVEGTMLGEDDERELLEEEDASHSGQERIGRRLGGSRALGSTSLGAPIVFSQDGMNVDSAITKHRLAY